MIDDDSEGRVVSALPKDAIPSVDDSTFGDEYVGDPTDGVLIVEPADDTVPARGYPIRILNYHEVVNDTVPVATGDGLHAFERPDFGFRVEDGAVHGDGAT